MSNIIDATYFILNHLKKPLLLFKKTPKPTILRNDLLLKNLNTVSLLRGRRGRL